MRGSLLIGPLLLTASCVRPLDDTSACGTLQISEDRQLVEGSTRASTGSVPNYCPTFLSCAPDRLTVWINPGCRFEVKLSGRAGTVEPGGTCIYTDPQRVQHRIYTTGGTFELKGEVPTFEVDYRFESYAENDLNTSGTRHESFTPRAAEVREEDLDAEKKAELCTAPTPAEIDDHAQKVRCFPGELRDRSDPGANRTISFGASLGASYTPRCLVIAAGQSVTWSGDFSGYPLRSGLPHSATAGAVPNPIQNAEPAESKLTVEFPLPGDFLFHNPTHAETGMRGLVRVR
jgi:plastocyanin